MSEKRFVVLDRDGTIIFERHYLSDPRLVELIPGAALGMRRMDCLGLGLIGVTNQSGIGRGYFDQARVDLIHHRLIALLRRHRVRLDGIYFCPHTPDDDCSCRKPRPGLIHAAAQELDFDPRRSFVIGDNPCDIGLGQAVGATTFLVRTGYGEQFVGTDAVSPDYAVDDLEAAAQVIASLLRRPISSTALSGRARFVTDSN